MTALEKYRQRPPSGSVDYYRQRCEELATENDELRVRLDAALERIHELERMLWAVGTKNTVEVEVQASDGRTIVYEVQRAPKTESDA